MTRRERRHSRRGWPWWVHLLVAVLVVALVQGLAVKIGRIPSGSMEQTLTTGQMIAIDRLTPRWDPVGVGDVIVFEADDAWLGGPRTTITGPVSFARWGLGVLGYGSGLKRLMVKRVIAGEGQSVACCSPEGRLMVDGEPLDEPYVHDDYLFVPGEIDCESGSLRCFSTVTVPQGRLLVLGDHRSNSGDSVSACRATHVPGCARFVDTDDVLGRVLGVG